ncbi:hypothetical protein E0D97_14710 [Oricola cellulosilytica]|uniref:Uncharacterized protein n=1 Tax=Oricola cellulosilytica TaxID=1429082 RepID=A0A4R0P5S7_9HYPH|nr:hypothetical protein E0D97_14710 [Oricola cellulosilytica]
MSPTLPAAPGVSLPYRRRGGEGRAFGAGPGRRASRTARRPPAPSRRTAPRSPRCARPQRPPAPRPSARPAPAPSAHGSRILRRQICGSSSWPVLRIVMPPE